MKNLLCLAVCHLIATMAFNHCRAEDVLVAAKTSASKSDELTTTFREQVEPLLQKHCNECHSGSEPSGNLAFDTLQSNEQIDSPELWLKVIKNLRAGIMPPKDSERLSADSLRQFETWIKDYAFHSSADNPDPGRVTIPRLNRVEYRNVMRDLLGVDFQADSALPPDDVGYGFDNIGDVLSISPMRLEKFIEAAITVVDAVVPKDSIALSSETHYAEDFIDSNGRNADHMSFYQTRTVSRTFKIEEEGDYIINIYCKIDGEPSPRDPQECRIRVSTDGKEFFTEKYGWSDNDWFQNDCKIHWEPGEHTIDISTEPVHPDLKPLRTKMEYRLVSLRVDGPLDRAKWKPPAGYNRFYHRDAPPTDPVERREYAREVLERFSAKAFRRPVSADTLQRLVKVAEDTYSQPDTTFEMGISQAIVAVLASPKFLFKYEVMEPLGEGEAFPKIDEYSLASRLSFALWRSMPDDELFELAANGELRANLKSQVERMLADPKSKGFVEGFSQQWLQTAAILEIPINSESIMLQEMTEAEKKAAEEERAAASRRFGGRPPGANPNAGPPPFGPRPRVDEPAEGPSAQATEGSEQPSRDGRQAAADSSPPSARPAEGAPASGQNGDNQNPQARPGNRPPGFPGGFGRRGRREYDGKSLTPQVRQAMRQEVEEYFAYVMREDRSVLEFLDSNYTFVNADLAKLYGLQDVTGSEMRKVDLPEGNPRGGVLTMGGVLTVTSNPTRTSPVKRGKWVLENILGAPTAPPPPNIPALEDSLTKTGDHKPTQREVLAIHRESPLCASCHERMDPLGLALENFNGFGRYRESEFEQPIEPAGELITGESFDGVVELKAALVENHKPEFYRALTGKLMTYVLGRGVEYYDLPVIDQIAERMMQDNGKFSTMLMGVLESPQMHYRRPTAESDSNVQDLSQN